MKLFSRVFGFGQPMIVIHGLFGMSDNWQSIAKKLADFFEVHLIDLRNHGQSPHSDEFNYQHMVSDLAVYISDHRLKDTIIVGHSLGGKVAMTFASCYASQLQKLVVVDISPRHYPVHHQSIIEGLKSLDFTTIKTRQQANEQLSKYIDNESLRQFLLKSVYWKEKNQLAFRFNLSSISQNISEIGKPLSENAKFDKPTLFLKGEMSDYIMDYDENLIFHHFPNAKIENMDGCGHWLHAEKPIQFFEKVVRFCI